jgi:hypothetical protein
MQVLPLLGFALTRPWAVRRWRRHTRTQLVGLAGAAYLSLTALVTWQALRGQSIVAPDLLTLSTAFVMLAFGLVWLGIFLQPQDPHQRSMLEN